MKNIALIVAAGTGSRFGGEIPKQYQSIEGKTILSLVLESFLKAPFIDAISVVIHKNHHDFYQKSLHQWHSEKRLLSPVEGGETRQESVRKGLLALQKYNPNFVFIHDAARPYLPLELLYEMTQILQQEQAVAPCSSIGDSLHLSENGYAIKAVDRSLYKRVQTPQAFDYQAILNAHLNFSQEAVTDDIALLTKAGLKVRLIESDNALHKITFPQDLQKMQKMDIRTGMGFDVHRFCTGDHLFLGGVKIQFSQGLEGHSDADVVLHAVTDALLGAISEGDIGVHFPPSNPQWRGANSSVFLCHAASLVHKKGFKINHLDVTIIGEQPKITPHREAIRTSIASLLQMPLDRVSVKATTTERLGFTGRKEGLAAQAIVTLL